MLRPQLNFQPSPEHIGIRASAWSERADSIAASWVFLVGLFILLFFYLWYGSNRGINLNDEGAICTGAASILRGGVPYRDFWSIYGPGEFYLLAGLFKLFGTTLLTASVYTVFVEWIVAIFAYLLVKKLTGPLGAAVSCIAVVVWLNFDRYTLYPIVPALLFVLAGFLVLTYFSFNLILNIVAGLLVGCAILVRHDLGVYGFAGLAVTVLGERLLDEELRNSTKHSLRFASAINPIFALSVGTAAVVLPVFLALLYTVPHRILYVTFIDFPFRSYAKYRSIPFSTEFVRFVSSGGLRDRVYEFIDAMAPLLIMLLPLFFFCMTWVFVVMGWIKKNRPLRERWLAAGLALFGFGLYYSVKVRPDHYHMVASVAISLILFPWLFQTAKGLVSMRWMSLSLQLVLIVCVAILSLKGHQEKKRAIQDHNWIKIAGVDRARGILIPKEEVTSGLTEAIDYIQRRTAPNQFIYVGDRRHDLIFINNALFYFLSDRASATRYTDLLPGVVTTSRVQSEIINDLKSHNVAYVVLCSMPLSNEPNKSSVSSGVTILDDFIRNNYKSVAEFGKYSILQRSGAFSGPGQ